MCRDEKGKILENGTVHENVILEYFNCHISNLFLEWLIARRPGETFRSKPRGKHVATG
jgi:hypothetical protein